MYEKQKVLIPLAAEKIKNHASVIEQLLWEGVYGEWLSFDDEGNPYHSNSGEPLVDGVELVWNE